MSHLQDLSDHLTTSFRIEKVYLYISFLYRAYGMNQGVVLKDGVREEQLALGLQANQHLCSGRTPQIFFDGFALAIKTYASKVGAYAAAQTK